MDAMDDRALLRRYADNQSGEAFAALVNRHIHLVYSIALRQVGNSHHAEEITQAVFVILAKKALQLRHNNALSSWLFQTTHLTSNNFLRSETRRHHREQEAYMQKAFAESGDNIWPQIAPLLEAAVASLNEKDRRAVVLRFYEGKNLCELGAALTITEEAAKKRVSRALDKLQRYFSRRGVNSTAAVIDRSMSENAVQMAPAALVMSVTALAVAKGASASGSTLTLIKGALKVMAWTKAKTAITVAAGVLIAAGTTKIAVNKIESFRLDAYLKDPQLHIPSNAPPIVALRLTHSPKPPAMGQITGNTDGEREIGRNIHLSTAIEKAYDFYSFQRMVIPEEVGKTRVDYLVTVPDHPREKFQAEIKRQFGWTAHFETRPANVLLMKVGHPDAPGLSQADDSPWNEWMAKHPAFKGAPGIHYHDMTVSNFAVMVENLAPNPKPIVDGTGLTGKYDFVTGTFGAQQMEKVFRDQLGLVLVPTNMPIEMLVVEKAK